MARLPAGRPEPATERSDVITYEIKALDLMDCSVESSFLVLARGMGQQVQAKIYA